MYTQNIHTMKARKLKGTKRETKKWGIHNGKTFILYIILPFLTFF